MIFNSKREIVVNGTSYFFLSERELQTLQAALFFSQEEMQDPFRTVANNLLDFLYARATYTNFPIWKEDKEE